MGGVIRGATAGRSRVGDRMFCKSSRGLTDPRATIATTDKPSLWSPFLNLVLARNERRDLSNLLCAPTFTFCHLPATTGQEIGDLAL